MKTIGDKTYVTLADCRAAARNLVGVADLTQQDVIYGIPRGGIVPALMVAKECGGTYTDKINEATFVVDDLINSGKTAERVMDSKLRQGGFGALFSKGNSSYECGVFVKDVTSWLVFPWEVGDTDTSKDDIVTRILEAIGEDPRREGLLDTPKRVIKAWGEWFAGYHIDPATLLTTFNDGAEGVDEMVLVRDIPVYSHCEHHITPFIGVAHVAYIPNKKIVGLSKLSRVVDAYSRRLQVQERLTNQIANCLQDNLEPLGVAVVVRAQHFCMLTRGVKVANSETITSAMRGAFLSNPETRAEFMGLIK